MSPVLALFRRLQAAGVTGQRSACADSPVAPSPANVRTVRKSSQSVNHTARSRTSGEYLVLLSIAPSSQKTEPPGKSGRFNVLAKTIIGLYRTEVNRRQGPFRYHEAAELAPLEWVE